MVDWFPCRELRMSKKLSITDYAFLALETPEMPLHVGLLMTFNPPAGRRGDFVQSLVAGMRESTLVAPFSYVLRPAKAGLPSWGQVSEFDPYYHIRQVTLPKPGNHQQLAAQVTDLHRRLMDRSRPLWEFYLIEGLRGGRFAVYLKVHHAIFDGMSLLHAMNHWLSDSPGTAPVPVWSVTATPAMADEPSLLGRIGKAFESAPSSLAEAGRVLRGLPDVGPFLFKRVEEALGARDSLMVTPYRAHDTPMDSAGSSKRIFGFVDLPLQRVKALGKRNNASVNDIILTVCDMAILRFMEEQGTPLQEPLVLSIAISLRKPGDTSVGGNNATGALLSMADLDADPASRLDFLRASVKEARSELGSVAPELAAAYGLMAGAPGLLAERLGLAGSNPWAKLQNVVISNPFGLSESKYLGDAELESLVPVSGLIGGASLNISLFSYTDRIYCGLIGFAETMPDIHRLGELLKLELKRLERALD